MRKLTTPILVAAVTTSAAVGCDGSFDLLQPEASAPAVSATASDGARLVPYRAEASFEPGSASLTVCDLPPGYAGDPVALPSLLLATGQHSHLGRTTSRITIENCELTSAGVLGGGAFVHTSARGDGFSGSWDALFTPPVFAFVSNGKPHPIVAESGTGRFEGLDGHWYGRGTIDLATGTGTFFVRGMISPVGSSE